MPPEMPRSKKGDAYLKKRKFLAAYAATGNMSLAARSAGIAKSTHWDWLRAEAARPSGEREYTDAFHATQDEAAQTLEDEAVRRAHEGVKRPVMYKGAPVKQGRRILYETEYSDQLLLALLKRFRPALYRDHVTTEHTGSIEIVDRLQAARKRIFEMRRNDAGATG